MHVRVGLVESKPDEEESLQSGRGSTRAVLKGGVRYIFNAQVKVAPPVTSRKAAHAQYISNLRKEKRDPVFGKNEAASYHDREARPHERHHKNDHPQQHPDHAPSDGLFPQHVRQVNGGHVACIQGHTCD